MTSIYRLNSEQDHDGHAIVGQRVGEGGENIVVVTFAPESNLAASLAERLKSASSLFPFVQALTFGGFLPAEDDGEAQVEGEAAEGEAVDGEAKLDGDDSAATDDAPEEPTAYAVLVNGEVVLSFLCCQNITVTPAIAEQGDDLSSYERFIFGLSDDEVAAASEALKFGLGTAAGDDELYFLLTGKPAAEEAEVEAAVEPEAAEGAQVVDGAGAPEAEAAEGETAVVEGETAAVEGEIAAGEGDADAGESDADDSEDAGEKQAKAQFGGLADGVYKDASFDHEGTVVYVIAIGELKD